MRRLWPLVLALSACGPRDLTECDHAGWTERGNGPEGFQTVVEVVRAASPNLPICGIVNWIPSPWDCAGEGIPDCQGQRAMVYGPPLLSVVARPLIEDTALTHEMGHLLGFDDGPALDAWVAARNAEVARGMGR